MTEVVAVVAAVAAVVRSSGVTNKDDIGSIQSKVKSPI